MDEHAIGLFIHIAGGLGLFVALGLEWTGLGQIRSAILPEQVRAWMGIFKSARRMLFISMLTTVITGIYSMLTEWGGVAWIIASLGSIVLMIVLAMMLTVPRMAAIERALATGRGAVSQSFHNLTSHPLLWISIQVRVAIALGIVFLMAAKPGLVGSLLTIGIAIVLGLASALPTSRRVRTQGASAD